MNEYEADIKFDENHPTAAGHFPGRPIIPGALLIDAILQLIPEGHGDGGTVIRSAKFFRPVTPGQEVRVTWTPATDDVLIFKCFIKNDMMLVANICVEKPKRAV
ncbi:MAG: hypothetical protein POH28_07630 [Acidocella sp.]|nr:hypothetical protein [Acidocella sp.]